MTGRFIDCSGKIWCEHIDSDASILVGTSIIKGSRLSVEFLRGWRYGRLKRLMAATIWSHALRSPIHRQQSKYGILESMQRWERRRWR